MCLYMLHILAFALVNAFLAPSASIPVSRADLRAIAVAYQECLDSTGKPPARADDLQRFLHDNRLYVALKRGDVVFHHGISMNHPVIAANGTSHTMMAHEKDAPVKGGLIVMFDCTVHWVTPADFSKVMIPHP